MKDKIIEIFEEIKKEDNKDKIIELMLKIIYSDLEIYNKLKEGWKCQTGVIAI